MDNAPDETILTELPTFDRSPDDRMQFARMNIRDWLQGMRTLKPDQIGVYNVILFLLYDNLGMLRDDDRYVAGHCQMDVRYYKKVKAQLVTLGKIEVRDGHLWNRRATTEIASFCATAKLKRKAALEREAKKRGARASGARQAPDRSASGASQVRDACATRNANPEIANNNNDGSTTALPLLSVEKETEKEKEKEKDSNPLPPKRGRRRKARDFRRELCQIAFDRYCAMADPIGLSVPRATSFETYAGEIFARLLEHGGAEASDTELLAIWDEALRKVTISSWLRGNNDRQFKASLSFMCQAKSFRKLLSGNYGNGAHVVSTYKAKSDGLTAEQRARVNKALQERSMEAGHA